MIALLKTDLMDPALLVSQAFRAEISENVEILLRAVVNKVVGAPLSSAPEIDQKNRQKRGQN
jgi:hypothetical protein